MTIFILLLSVVEGILFRIGVLLPIEVLKDVKLLSNILNEFNLSLRILN